jgi:excisionase family DNA binding protein
VSASAAHHSKAHRPVPVLLKVAEVASIIKTSKKAIYALIERGALPGVIRLGRRILICEECLVDWLRQKFTPSLGSK